jgi:gluconolactonase
MAQTQYGNVVVKFDPALDELVSTNAKLELVRGGYGFLEGVVWVPDGGKGYVLMSDMPANVIFKITPDGEQHLFLDRSGYRGYDIWRVGFMQTNGKDRSDPLFEEFPMIGSNGLTLDPQGRLVFCTWAGRSIDRIEHDGTRVTLCDRYEGKQFNGTNDVIVKKNGTIYFTDGFNGLRHREKDPRKGIDFRGIFMLKDGKVTHVIKDIEHPNGLALSPDEKILYANGSRLKFVRAYDVLPDDTVTNSRLFYDLSVDKRPGITDGMKVDQAGNIYESGPRGIWIFSPDGRHLGTILTPELVANMAFGDPDRRTLYIVARMSLYKIRVNTPGI